ncbi:MAG: heat-inducible transcriptional repressor HrcA [Acetobacter sp.]|nr:heat-inducible transcriptional repressor HrcA [Bacteroides sp.]MCM1340266.1 heat-inducible transcriptional repressor HrcA [Acetobacter sp.]MCM1432784.1 heat-inducible transcriptional repressor HrcA [Clostridiales bacterium]
MISERRLAILNLIVEHYLQTGEPMGSKTLCSLLPYTVSSATIRNEMAYLSELGFLEQRHTSGGRVPSKACYRYYIDNLMEEYPISAYYANNINEILSVNAGDPERLFSDASKLISQYTHCAGFSCVMEDNLDCIQGVDLIPAGSSKAMLVMLTLGSKIKSSLINMPCRIDDNFRYLFYEVMQRLFIGTPLIDVNPALVQSSVLIAGERVFDLLPVLVSLCSLCREASNTTLNIDGETNLLSHEELGTDVYKLLSFLADKGQMKKLLKEFSNNKVKSTILIGDENPFYEMKNTSTIVSQFTYGNNQKACLGLIGSTRINYKKIIPIVRYIFETVDKLISKEVRNG